MIRRLIILLLIVGCVFADTIEYESNEFGDWDTYNREEYNINSFKKIIHNFVIGF